jgi:hypothetical protein
MPAASESRARPPTTVLVVLAMALGFGAVAALLTAPLPHQPSSAGPTSGVPQLTGFRGLQVVAGASVAVIFGWIGLLIYQRLRRGNSLPFNFGARYIVTLAVVLLLLLAFLILAHAPASPAGTTPGKPAPGPPMPPPGANGSGGSNNSSALSRTPAPPPVLVWVEILGAAVAAAIGILVVYPLVSRLASRARNATGPDAPSPGRRAIADALAALEARPFADPRAVIVALYGRLLVQVEPRVEGIEHYTPREIERVAVATLGVGGETARTLTGLFEEARYSTHPMDADDSVRARAALGRALEEMDARLPPGAGRGLQGAIRPVRESP